MMERSPALVGRASRTSGSWPYKKALAPCTVATVWEASRRSKATVPDGPRNQLVAGTWDSTAVLLAKASV